MVQAHPHRFRFSVLRALVLECGFVVMDYSQIGITKRCVGHRHDVRLLAIAA